MIFLLLASLILIANDGSLYSQYKQANAIKLLKVNSEPLGQDNNSLSEIHLAQISDKDQSDTVNQQQEETTITEDQYQ